MSLANLFLYILLIFCFSVPAILFIYFIGSVFAIRSWNLFRLVRIFKVSFRSSHPSIESYGYRITRTRGNERLFRLYFNRWQRAKFRSCMLIVAIGGLIRMYWLQIKALCWGIHILHKSYPIVEKRDKLEIKPILDDVINMLSKNEIDKAQRKLKYSLEKVDFSKYKPCNLLFLSICNQMLQEIKSAERILLANPKAEREAKKIVCNSVGKLLNDLLSGRKYKVYDEILKREFIFNNL